MQLNTETIDTPPRDAASVVMIRDGDDGRGPLQVLLVRRHTASSVLGGACVFPGGKLDAADSAPEVLARLDRPARELQPHLGEAALSLEQAAGFYVAALREAFEECGVLYASRGGCHLPAAECEGAAARLKAGTAFAALLAELDLQLDTHPLEPWSRWITPRQPSVMNKRFDTRFFLAVAAPGQTARHDDYETTETLWLTPHAAIEQYQARAIALAPPQIMGLAHLSHFANTAAAMDDARRRRPPLIEPESFTDDSGARVLCYPGDERHSVRERALPTPTRLRWVDGRFQAPEGFGPLLL